MFASRYPRLIRQSAAVGLLLLGGIGGASAQPDLARYVDRNRVLLVFAPRADDPSFSAQQSIFMQAKDGMSERDLVLVPAVGADAADLRRRFKVEDGSFAALLIGKDGGIKMRSGRPIAARALFLTIDAMPMRRAEQGR